MISTYLEKGSIRIEANGEKATAFWCTSTFSTAKVTLASFVAGMTEEAKSAIAVAIQNDRAQKSASLFCPYAMEGRV